MTDRHPLDPLALHHAAGVLGEMVGAGRLPAGEAAACVVQWVGDGGFGAVHGPGLQMRLMHRVRDTARVVAARRENTERAIRWAVRPLFGRGASAAEIEEAAGRANGDVFAWDEVVPVLRDEMTRARARRHG